MKRLFKFIFILLICIPAITSAATISVTGPNTAVVGNQITVNVKLSAGESWQMILDYDSSFLKLVSGGGEAGGVNMVNTSVGNGSRSYSFRFQTLKTGKTNVSISSYDVVDDNGADISCSISSKTISIITQAELEASYSKNNDLKSLVVDGFEITPAFDKNVYDYNVTVPENTTEVDVKATPADNRSTITGEGKLAVELGTNKFEIIVKAQNGDEKKYTLTVDVKDSNPIEVNVDNKKYTVVKISKNLPKPNGYTETTVKIEDYDVPAYKSDITKLTLVGLKDSEGDINLFIYDNGKYEKYIDLNLGSINIYVKDGLEKLKGYTKGICSIKDNEIDCLYKKKSDRYKIIYGVNVESNEEGYFLYDSKDKALIKYDMSAAESLNEKIDILTYVSIGLAATTFISLILLINISSKKGKKKINKEKDNLVNTVIEEVEISEDNNDIIEEKETKKKEEKVEITSSDEEEYDNSFLSEKEKRKLSKKRK